MVIAAATESFMVNYHALTQVLRAACIILGVLAFAVITPVAGSFMRRQRNTMLISIIIMCGLISNIFTEVGRYMASSKITWRLPVNFTYVLLTLWLGWRLLRRERRGPDEA